VQSSSQTVEDRWVPPGQMPGRIRRYDWGATPGKLWVTQTILLLGVLVAGGVGFFAAIARVEATRDIAGRLEPLNATVTTLYRSLADADTTVAAGFLAGGVEPSTARARYDQDVAQAAASLARASTQASGEMVTTKRIADITTQLPVYTGLVERARANNRQGLAVGESYLRRASELMQSSILPAAAELQRRQAARLNDTYQRAGSVPVVSLAICGISLAGLVWAQIFLFHQTQRVFNIGLVVASLALLGGLVWWTVAGVASTRSLASALEHSRSVSDALAPAQIAALQARSVESLGLVTRTVVATGPDFDAKMQLLARNEGAGGALGAARQFTTDQTGRELVAAAIREAQRYASAHEQVRVRNDRGEYVEAVAAAVGAHEASSATAFDRLARALDAAVDHERRAFGSDIHRAESQLTGLPIGTGALALVAAVGVILGVGQRLAEYR
jgi:hypothetical protein